MSGSRANVFSLLNQIWTMCVVSGKSPILMLDTQSIRHPSNTAMHFWVGGVRTKWKLLWNCIWVLIVKFWQTSAFTLANKMLQANLGHQHEHSLGFIRIERTEWLHSCACANGVAQQHMFSHQVVQMRIKLFKFGPSILHLQYFARELQGKVLRLVSSVSLHTTLYTLPSKHWMHASALIHSKSETAKLSSSTAPALASIRVCIICTGYLLHTSVMLLHVLAFFFSCCLSFCWQAAPIIHRLELCQTLTNPEAVRQLHDHIWWVCKGWALLALENGQDLFKGQVQNCVLAEPQQS